MGYLLCCNAPCCVATFVTACCSASHCVATGNRRRIIELELTVAEKAALLGIAQTEAEDLRKQLTHNLEDYREKLGQYMRETTTIIRNTAEEVLRRPYAMRCHGWRGIS